MSRKAPGGSYCNWRICKLPSGTGAAMCFGLIPAVLSGVRILENCFSVTPRRRLTSRVARTCCQTARASPPETAIGTFRGARLDQTCSSAGNTTAAAIFVAPAIEFFNQVLHGAIVLCHQFGVPLTICRLHIAAGSNLQTQSRQQQLVTGFHQVEPGIDSLFRGQTGRKSRSKIGGWQQVRRHGFPPSSHDFSDLFAGTTHAHGLLHYKLFTPNSQLFAGADSVYCSRFVFFAERIIRKQDV